MFSSGPSLDLREVLRIRRHDLRSPSDPDVAERSDLLQRLRLARRRPVPRCRYRRRRREVLTESTSADSASMYGDHTPGLYVFAPDGTALIGHVQIAVKSGTLSEGDGVYGPGNVCLFSGVDDQRQRLGESDRAHGKAGHLVPGPQTWSLGRCQPLGAISSSISAGPHDPADTAPRAAGLAGRVRRSPRVARWRRSW